MSAAKVPLSERINLRMVIFFAVILIPIGYMVYLFADTWRTHGIWDARDSRYGSYKKVDLKAMSMFQLNQTYATDADIPAEYRALEGKRVMLVGEQYLRGSSRGTQLEFDLVYSIAKCCFNGPPQIQHFVKCKALPGKNIDTYVGLVKAVGILHVGVQIENGRVASVYRMDVESVEAAQ
ncbi:MAG TPA: hypothetical protein VGP94_11755 [Tepidisphaeraceae bacterium]|jgi:hypothetical protein|nr:hypothetical protein [Tepidisphaeraceae bacterium]